MHLCLNFLRIYNFPEISQHLIKKKKKKKKKRKKERKKKKKERKKKRKEKEGVASLCSGSLSCIIQMQWYSDLLGKE